MKVKNILVIDDDQFIRSFLKDALERQNYQVTTIEDGEAGIVAFKENAFDLVFVDMRLPNITGIEVLTKIKEIEPDTIVVIITGHATIENAVESMQLGAYNYLTKPVSVEDEEPELDPAKEVKSSGMPSFISELDDD